MRCKVCNKIITDLPEYCGQCDREMLREMFADTCTYNQAVKDCMAKLIEIKDLPAERCREELRQFVKNHSGGA